MSAPVTSAFAGSLAVVYAGLQLRVGLYRLGSGIVFGTKKDAKSAEDEKLLHISRAGEQQERANGQHQMSSTCIFYICTSTLFVFVRAVSAHVLCVHHADTLCTLEVLVVRVVLGPR